MKNKLINYGLPWCKHVLLNFMKFTILLFCTTVLSFSPKLSFSQEEVYINEDKLVTIDEIFEIITNQTQYSFIYPEGLFDKTHQIRIKKGEVKVKALLDKSLKSNNYDFNISKHKIIYVTIKSPMTSIQETEIRGTVKDKEGVPMPGVTVQVKGKSNGVATDFDGNFSVNVATNAILIVSYVGYRTQEIQVNADQTFFEITMEMEVNTLDEVVLVSSGYQKISRERSTGAFETLKKNQIEKPSSSISERLVGSIAGLQSTVNPDGSINFEIRGQSSLFADQEPLIVYDGFPIEGGFNTINPNDVESVTVLKDAAAASIWGAKSANGVIVITSKKAKEGKANVSFSSFVKASQKIDLDYSLARASSEEMIEYEQKAFETNFFGSLFGTPPGISALEIPSPFSLAIIAMNEARLGRISENKRDAMLSRLKNLDNKKQIEDLLLQAPVTRQYNLSVRGGSERMRNNFSLMFEDSENYFKENNKKKFLVNYKNDVEFTKSIDFNFSAMMQYDKAANNGVNLFEIQSLAPWDMLADENGNLTDMSYKYYYMPNFHQFLPSHKFPYADWFYNPVTEIKNRDLETTSLNSRIQAGLTLKIMDGLTVASKIQYEIFKTSYEDYYSDKTFAVRRFVNETSTWDFSDNAPTQNIPKGGVLRKKESTVNAYNFRNQLNFNRKFAKRHSVNFIAGTELSDRVYKETQNPDNFGYNDKTLSSSEILADINTAKMWTGFPLSFSQYFYDFRLTPTHIYKEDTSRFFSVYGNLGYTYDDKYSITGSYRTDASNLITDDPTYRFNPFWSVGAGWSVSNEKFMKGINWLDRLHIRSTYGFNGNVDRSTSFKPLINLNPSSNIYTGGSTATISSYGNPTLRWEKTNTTNIGVDFSIYNRKLFGSVDVYRKKGYDLIVDQSISSVNGTTNQKFNNGKMMNKGVEVTLGTTMPIKKNDIVWSGAFNFAYNNNEITSFYKANYFVYDLYRGPTTSYVEGFDANTLWAYQYAGLMNVGTDENPVLKPSVVGANGEKVSLTNWARGNAVEFMQSQGTTVAPTTLGMRNVFRIYDFELSFIITAKLGHVYRRHGFNYPYLRDGKMINNKYNEVVTSGASNKIPIPDVEPLYHFYERYYPYMDYLTEDASHIRFQEINMTYSVPRYLIQKMNISSLNIFLQANNIGLVAFNDYGEDPEYPMETLRLQPSLTFGLNLNF